MKKVLVMMLLLICLSSCDEFYEKFTKLENGIYIYYNEKTKTASISSLWIDDLEENHEVTIPDEYNDCIIDTLGYDNSNSKLKDIFSISWKIYEYNYTEKSDSMTIVPITTKIYLNKNISRILEIDTGDYFYFKEGETECYKLDCYFIIPEDNKIYYSDNGNIYSKVSDELIYKRWSLE